MFYTGRKQLRTGEQAPIPFSPPPFQAAPFPAPSAPLPNQVQAAPVLSVMSGPAAASPPPMLPQPAAAPQAASYATAAAPALESQFPVPFPTQQQHQQAPMQAATPMPPPPMPPVPPPPSLVGPPGTGPVPDRSPSVSPGASAAAAPPAAVPSTEPSGPAPIAVTSPVRAPFVSQPLVFSSTAITAVDPAAHHAPSSPSSTLMHTSATAAAAAATAPMTHPAASAAPPRIQMMHSVPSAEDYAEEQEMMQHGQAAAAPRVTYSPHVGGALSHQQQRSSSLTPHFQSAAATPSAIDASSGDLIAENRRYDSGGSNSALNAYNQQRRQSTSIGSPAGTPASADVTQHRAPQHYQQQYYQQPHHNINNNNGALRADGMSWNTDGGSPNAAINNSHNINSNNAQQQNGIQLLDVVHKSFKLEQKNEELLQRNQDLERRMQQLAVQLQKAEQHAAANPPAAAAVVAAPKKPPRAFGVSRSHPGECCFKCQGVLSRVPPVDAPECEKVSWLQNEFKNLAEYHDQLHIWTSSADRTDDGITATMALATLLIAATSCVQVGVPTDLQNGTIKLTTAQATLKPAADLSGWIILGIIVVSSFVIAVLKMVQWNSIQKHDQCVVNYDRGLFTAFGTDPDSIWNPDVAMSFNWSNMRRPDAYEANKNNNNQSNASQSPQRALDDYNVGAMGGIHQ